jgi:DNA repair exonuclease SbcCD ATPase subunit
MSATTPLSKMNKKQLYEKCKDVIEENEKIGGLVISQTERLRDVSIKHNDLVVDKNAYLQLGLSLQEENKKLIEFASELQKESEELVEENKKLQDKNSCHLDNWKFYDTKIKQLEEENKKLKDWANEIISFISLSEIENLEEKGLMVRKGCGGYPNFDFKQSQES